MNPMTTRMRFIRLMAFAAALPLAVGLRPRRDPAQGQGPGGPVDGTGAGRDGPVRANARSSRSSTRTGTNASTQPSVAKRARWLESQPEWAGRSRWTRRRPGGMGRGGMQPGRPGQS